MAITVSIGSDFKPQGLDRAIKEFQSLEGAGAKAAFAIKKAAVPAAAALTAITVLGKKFINAGEAAATAEAAIENIAKQMDLFGGDTKKVTDRLIAYAEATARATGVDNLAIKATQAKLLTFGELAKTADEAGGAFDRATAAAIDLAAAGFGSAESNAVQLGKALNDPIKGIAALAKSGVTFTDQEKEKIKTLVASNKTLEAQELVLAAIEKQVGGTALATANDTDKMKEAFAQASQSIGKALLPFLQKLVPVLGAVARFAERNKGIIIAVGFAVAGLATAVLAANAALKLYAAGKAIVTAATWAWNAALNANPISLIVLGVAALTAGLVLAYQKVEVFRDIVDAVFAFVKTVIGQVIDKLGVLKDVAFAVFEGIKGFVESAIQKFTGFRDRIVGVFDRIKNVVSGVIDWLRANWDIVLAIFTGPIGAIVLVWRRFGDDLKDIARGIASAFSGAFEAASRIIKSVINTLIRGWNRLNFKVPGFKIGPIGYDGFTLGLPPIPELAKGGIIDRPGGILARVGEAGPEAVIPLSKLDTGSGTTIIVNGALDPVAVSRQIRKLLNDDATRSGRTAFL